MWCAVLFAKLQGSWGPSGSRAWLQRPRSVLSVQTGSGQGLKLGLSACKPESATATEIIQPFRHSNDTHDIAVPTGPSTSPDPIAFSGSHTVDFHVILHVRTFSCRYWGLKRWCTADCKIHQGGLIKLAVGFHGPGPGAQWPRTKRSRSTCIFPSLFTIFQNWAAHRKLFP